MKSNSFTNEIVIEFTQGNICLTSKLIFLEALNNPIDYLFMNIAFNFIVRFRGVFFCLLEMGQSRLFVIFISCRKQDMQCLHCSHQVIILLEMYSVYLANT